jgi:hypothetical protein
MSTGEARVGKRIGIGSGIGIGTGIGMKAAKYFNDSLAINLAVSPVIYCT